MANQARNIEEAPNAGRKGLRRALYPYCRYEIPFCFPTLYCR